MDDIKINSRLTLGEDLADLGGAILAWAAGKDATECPALRPKDGLTPGQRFFVRFAQRACENQRDEDKRVNALTNPHLPALHRSSRRNRSAWPPVADFPRPPHRP